MSKAGRLYNGLDILNQRAFDVRKEADDQLDLSRKFFEEEKFALSADCAELAQKKLSELRDILEDLQDIADGIAGLD